MLRAPAETQALLLELAECDLALARAHAQLSKLAETLGISELERTIDSLKHDRHEALIDREAIEAELSRAESDVELVEARIARDSERLSQTSSAKDAQGLEHELASLRARRSDLEDIELAIMERLEAAQTHLDECEAAVVAAESRLLAAQDEEQATSARVSGEIKQTSETRAGIVARLPEDLYELYERQRARYGAGASHLRGGVSSASGVTLTESDLQTIRAAAPDEVVLCPDSNAILVRTAESGL